MKTVKSGVATVSGRYITLVGALYGKYQERGSKKGDQ